MRQQILATLRGGRIASPKEIASELGQPLPRTSYHMTVLREKGALELVRTEPARGSLRHYYRATIDISALADDAAIEPGLRGELEQVLRRNGAHHSTPPSIEYSSLELDRKGQEEVAALLAETTRALEKVQQRAANRIGRSKGGAPATEYTELAVVQVTRAPQPRSKSARTKRKS